MEAPDSLGDLTLSIQGLAQCISDLKAELHSSRAQCLAAHQSEPTQDERFISTSHPLPPPQPKFGEEGEPVLAHETKCWLNHLFHEVVATGFLLLKKKRLNSRQMKAFCSERLVFNILRLIEQQDLGTEHVRMINEFVKEEVLEYLILKYPKSEEKEVNQNFKRVLKPVDNLSSNENDLVFRSGVGFKHSPDANYNSKIMEFLNFVISLPDTPVELEGQTVPLEDLFHEEVGSFFRRIEDEEELKLLQFEGRSNEEEAEMFRPVLQKVKEFIGIKSQRAEKVRGYSKYETDRKLTKNIEPFTKKEIQEGNLDFKHPALMRIVVKWCQELENNYSSIFQRRGPFRAVDGSEKFLESWHLGRLEECLAGEKECVRESMKLILQNNYDQQRLLAKDDAFEGIGYFSEFEAKTGIFNARAYKNSKVYLITYLNALIHGLLKASSESGANVNLVSFNVGDLLRSRCSSKEVEVIALYQGVLKANRCCPEVFKVVSVRNRLAYVTKDILINILYRNRLVIEMQLGINGDQSAFIESSNKLNHFIYELQRGSFGPLAELGSMWMTVDPRAEYYQSKAEKLKSSMKKEAGDRGHECTMKEIELTLPFKCSLCFKYVSSSRTKKHRSCQECQRTVCFKCIVRKAQNYWELKELFPSLKGYQELEDYTIFRGGSPLPRVGFILEIKSKDAEPQRYQLLEKDDMHMLFTKDGTGKIKLITEFPSREQLAYARLLNYYLVMQPMEQEPEFLETEEVHKKYFLPRYLGEATSKEHESILINFYGARDNVLSEFEGRKFARVRNLNAMENSLTSVAAVARPFPELELVVLSNNSIELITSEECALLKNTTEIHLSENPLRSISEDIGTLTQLKALYLNQNEMEALPESLCRCKELVTISLYDCKLLQTLPKDIGHLAKLTSIDLSFCQSLQFLPDSMRELENLKSLDCAYAEKLAHLPSSVAKWKKLESLNLLDCKSLESLPDDIGECSALENLLLAGCKALKSIPKSFGALRNLKEELSLGSHDHIDRLPAELGNHRQLSCLEIKEWDSLTTVSACIGSLASLKEIYIIDCWNLESLPDVLGGCQQLSCLEILNNSRLTHLPKSLCKCRSLTTLRLDQAKAFQELPEMLGACEQLRELQIADCPSLEELPGSLGRCLKLSQIHLQRSGVRKLPSTLGECLSLRILRLKQCQLLEAIPESVEKCLNLEKLMINECNGIRRIPQRFQLCKELRLLDIVTCQLLDPLPEIGHSPKLSLHLSFPNMGDLLHKLNCKQLLKLHLMKNDTLEQVPDSLGGCTDLKQLSIGQCENLVAITEEIRSLKKLKLLDIKKCPQLGSLPDGVGGCQSLHNLIVYKCPRIKALPPSIFLLKDLPFAQLRTIRSLECLPSTISQLPRHNTSLDCSHMEALRELPPSLGSMLHLQALYLRECPSLQALPSELSKLQSLKILDLVGCSNLEHIGWLPGLSVLKVSECPALRSDPQTLSKFTTLKAVEVVNYVKPPPLLSGLSSLQKLKHLKLTGCSFTIEPHQSLLDEVVEYDYSAAFWSLNLARSLVSLTIQQCAGFIAFSDSVDPLKTIEKLKVRQCEDFKFLPANISECEELTTVEVSGCASFSELPASIGDCKRLRSLVLRGCANLKGLPKSIMSCSSLQELDIAKTGVEGVEGLKAVDLILE